MPLDAPERRERLLPLVSAGATELPGAGSRTARATPLLAFFVDQYPRR